MFELPRPRRALLAALAMLVLMACASSRKENRKPTPDPGDDDAGTVLPKDDAASDRDPDADPDPDPNPNPSSDAEVGSAPTDAAGAASQDGILPLHSGDSVFFVGNSFFSVGDRTLADWAPGVGRALSPPVTLKSGSFIQPGNETLSWFLKQAAVQSALGSKKYKVFVIQGEDREPVDDKQNFKKAVRDFDRAIRAAGAQTMLFMTWDLSSEKGSDFFAKLSGAYDEIGAELNIPVIPVGLIYDDCNKDPYGGFEAGSYWLTGGELHQTETGSAVNAYATFAMLTGINPRGVFIDGNNNNNDAAMMPYLSDKSWARVESRLFWKK